MAEAVCEPFKLVVFVILDSSVQWSILATIHDRWFVGYVSDQTHHLLSLLVFVRKAHLLQSLVKSTERVAKYDLPEINDGYPDFHGSFDIASNDMSDHS